MGCAIFSWKFAKRLICLGVATTVFGCLLSIVLTYADGTDGSPSAWVKPANMTMLHIGAATDAPSAPTFLYNLDCTTVSYRMVDGADMKTGCFTATAFGMLDSDDGVIIFNGTDEGLPLLPYTAHQILMPWPKAMDLIALNPLSTGGAQIGLYTDPLDAFHDARDLTGQLKAKQLFKPPDMILKDGSGRPLVVNPQSLAFSEGGGWMAAETLSGSFVRMNLSSLGVKAFAPAYGSQGSPALLRSRVALSDDGRFIAVSNDVAAQFKVYDLTTCHGSVPNLPPTDIPPENCESYDYWPFASSQIAGLRSVRKIRFLNDGLISLETLANSGADESLYELAPYGSITSLTDYIGLGDSYTSGEGAFDYLAGTTGPDNSCHLSYASYPLLISRDLFGQGGHSVACSGALIRDIGDASDNYRGQARGEPSLKELEESEPSVLESVETGFKPGVVAQRRFISRWQPGIATVSVGGNDVGFGDLLKNCVGPHISLRHSDNDCYSSYEDRLELTELVDRTVPRWTALYRQLTEEAPGMRLYVIGYPQIAVADGNCADNVRLSKEELGLSRSFIEYIDSSIKKAADAAGVRYVDISQALRGHRLCEAADYDVAMNGLTAGDDSGPGNIRVLGKESYHPNALGQSLIEQSILMQTHNLGGPVIENSTDKADPSDMLAAPKTGRVVNMLVPDDNLTYGKGLRGSSIALHASGASDGLLAHTSYSISLDGAAGIRLGTTLSDDSGDISTDVNIPDDAIPGGHTIDISGENQLGRPVDITQPFYIAASGSDGDAGSMENFTDVCPGITDEACDAPAGMLPGIYVRSVASSKTVFTKRTGRPESGGPAPARTGSYGTHTAGLRVTGMIRPAVLSSDDESRYMIVALIIFMIALIALLSGKVNKRGRFWVQ